MALATPRPALIPNTEAPAPDIAKRVALHQAYSIADHVPADGVLGDRDLECGMRQGERAADRERLVGLAARVPFTTVIALALQNIATDN